jgi:flagellar basal-body rod modification protein FlgD
MAYASAVGASSGTKSDSSSAVSNATSTLGKDDFLKLLIAQLTNQDPLDPLKDQDFIAQLATFSTLEQQTNMAKSLEQLTSLSAISSVGLIGHTVTYLDSEGATKTGTVSGVKFTEDGVVLSLKGGGTISLDTVESIA